MRTKRYSMLAVLVVLMLLLTTGFVPAQGTKAKSVVFPPRARVQGMTLAQWSVRYWQYDFSLPKSVHPALQEGSTECLAAMNGNVVFLIGNHSASSLDCTVPAGTVVLVTVIAVECSTLEEAPFAGKNEQELRDCVNAFSFTDASASLDDAEIPNLDRYVTTSRMFTFTMPRDNVLDLPAGSVGQSVSRGIFLPLRPMSEGTHTLHMAATVPELEFTLDMTLNLNVVSPNPTEQEN